MKRFFILLKKTFPNFVSVTIIYELEKYLSGCKRIADVGCGDASPLRFLENKYFTLGIDGHKDSISTSKKNKIHNEYIIGDIKKLKKLVKKKSYDAAVALDVIEHLNKKDGYKLLDDMEGIARKSVVILTPNGFVPQFNKDNKLQEHLSSWSVDDFLKKGYKVQGIYGTKFCNIFRNEDATLKFKPRFFWGLVWAILVLITHYSYTRDHPEYSIGLLATKILPKFLGN